MTHAVHSERFGDVCIGQAAIPWARFFGLMSGTAGNVLRFLTTHPVTEKNKEKVLLADFGQATDIESTPREIPAYREITQQRVCPNTTGQSLERIERDVERRLH